MVLSLDTDLQGVIDDAATASASLATIVAGSDAVVANFDGLKDLVDSLSAFASTMKDGVFYTPTGGIMPFAGSSAPDDWYLCNGDLFATLGLSAGDPLFDLLSASCAMSSAPPWCWSIPSRNQVTRLSLVGVEVIICMV